MSFKNINVSVKLWLIVLPAVLALAGLLVFFIFRITDVADRSKEFLYDEAFVSTAKIINADRDFYQAAIAEKELYLTLVLTADSKAALFDDFDANVQQVQDRIGAAIDNIKDNTYLYTSFTTDDTNITLEKLYIDFQAHFTAWLNAFDLKTMTGDMALRQEEFSQARNDIDLMTQLLEEYALTESANLKSDVQSSITMSVIVVSAVILLILILSTVIVLYLRKNIKYITNISQRIAQGELSITIDQKRIGKDELGKLVGATGQILVQLNAYVGYIDEITKTLVNMSDGDMRVNLKHDYAGQFKSIKDAFVGISESLGGTLETIRSASEQVNSGASMISSGAQMLAHGSTEQASAVEELSATIDKVSDETDKNAKEVIEAVNSMQNTLSKIDEGTQYMQAMLTAMNTIGETSNSIKSVIKLIDDIAFQTNILALNAAVEAARAGQYGKGFAVVAAEVKNLATKSADAANRTSDLIGSSITSVREGITIAQNTADALADVSEKVINVNKIFSGISVSSSTQARAMFEIKAGITQISNVVLSNSATAEESASASQELSSQAELLYNEVSRFNLDDHNTDNRNYLLLPKH